MIKKICIKLIYLYQKTISPDHGAMRILFPYGCCKYYPTCSEYTLRAINCHGVFKGFKLGLVRVLKCNPFSRGGFDFSYSKEDKR